VVAWNGIYGRDFAMRAERKRADKDEECYDKKAVAAAVNKKEANLIK